MKSTFRLPSFVSGHSRRGSGATSSREDRCSGKTKRQGKVLVMLAIILPVTLALVGLAIGVAQIQSCRCELVAIVDAAAVAAAETYASTKDIDLARRAALETARQNTVQAKPFALDVDDIEFGTLVTIGSETRFVPNTFAPTAVRVTGRFEDKTSMVNLIPTKAFQSAEVKIVRSSLFAETDRDIALVIDRSNSMSYVNSAPPPLPPPLGPTIGELPPPLTAPTGWLWCMAVPSPSRFLDAAAGSGIFLGRLTTTSPVEHVTLITFADHATRDVPLTTDYASVVSQLAALAQHYCGGGSNKSEGIKTGVSTLLDSSRPHAVKVLILITDNADPTDDPVHQAELAAISGVVVHTISLGPKTESVITLAERIASAGKGTHQHAAHFAALRLAILRLAANVPMTLFEET